MFDLLPACPIDELRSYLSHKGWNKTSQSDGDIEYWCDANNLGLTYFPCCITKIPLYVMIIVVEHQVNGKISEVPFYARIIRDRFPDGIF